MKTREQIIEEANQAFWAVIAREYPEIKTGDFPPDAHIAFLRAQEEAVQIWLDVNSD